MPAPVASPATISSTPIGSPVRGVTPSTPVGPLLCSPPTSVASTATGSAVLAPTPPFGLPRLLLHPGGASHGSRFGPALPATCMEVPALPHLPSTELSVGISSQPGMQTGCRESFAPLLTARRRIASSTTGLRPPWRAPPRAPPVKARWLRRQRRWGLPSVGLSCFATIIMCWTLLDPSGTCW